MNSVFLISVFPVRSVSFLGGTNHVFCISNAPNLFSSYDYTCVTLKAQYIKHCNNIQPDLMHDVSDSVHHSTQHPQIRTHANTLSQPLAPTPPPFLSQSFSTPPIITGQPMKTCNNNNNNKIRYSMQCLLGGYSSSEEAGVKRKVLRDVLNTE